MTSQFIDGSWTADLKEAKLPPIKADEPLSCDDCDFESDGDNSKQPQEDMDAPMGKNVDILFQGYPVEATPVNKVRGCQSLTPKHPNGCRCPLCQTELGYVPVEDPLPEETDPIERIPIEFRSFYRMQNPEFVFFDTNSPKTPTQQEVSPQDSNLISYFNRAFKWLIASQSETDFQQAKRYSYMQSTSCLREDHAGDQQQEMKH